MARKLDEFNLDDTKLNWINRLSGDGAKEYQPVTQAGTALKFRLQGLNVLGGLTAEDVKKSEYSLGTSPHSPWANNRPGRLS
jgi:hypothetical protein